MGVLTTTAGWFPMPAELRRARRRVAEDEIAESDLQPLVERATLDAIRLQEELGLDVLVDGQMDRSHIVAPFAERLAGVAPGTLVRCFGSRYYRKPRIVGDIARPASVTVERFEAARKLTSRPLKAVLPGPYSLMDWSFDEHYRSRRSCCMAFAAAVREEIEDLVAAGAREIQLDDPAIGARAEEMALVAEALGRLTANLAGRARVWVHIGYCDLRPVLDQVLALPVDGLMLEMANSRGEILDSLGSFPSGKLLAAGVLDVLSTEIDTREIVRERIERLLENVPAEQVWIAPDAGLRTLTPEQAEAKLRVMVEAASGFR